MYICICIYIYIYICIHTYIYTFVAKSQYAKLPFFFCTLNKRRLFLQRFHGFFAERALHFRKRAQNMKARHSCANGLRM